MNIQELTAYINQNIRNNGVQAITGDLMQNVLNSIVATLSDGANIVPGSVTRGAIAPGAVDNTPTAGSNNLITSTAVAAAIKAIQTVVLENKELTDTELQNIIKTANGLTDAVNDRIPISEKGMYNGVATLGADGRVPASQLPGFVDDVKEGYLFEGKFYRDVEHTEEIEPQGDKIYIDLVTDKEYRWGGTIFAPISESLALGETASTAYAGDKGKRNAEDIERLKTGKQDTLVSGENVKTLNGESILGAGDIKISGGGAELIPITWTELVALRDAGQLVVGGLYRLIDYEVNYSISNMMNSESHPFDMILTAIAPNILSEECKAMLHEGDDYYSQYNRDLAAWKIWYCIDNDITRFKWAHETNGKGVIYRMIDDNKIDAPFDFKQIRFYSNYLSKYIYTFSGISSDLDMSVICKGIYNVVLKSIYSPNIAEPNVAHFQMYNTNESVIINSYILGRKNYVKVKTTSFDTYRFSGNVWFDVQNLRIADDNSIGVGDLIICKCKNINVSGSLKESFLWGCENFNITGANSLIVAFGFDGVSSCKIHNSSGVTIMPGCKIITLNNCTNISIGNGCENIDLARCTGVSIGNGCENITVGDNGNANSFTKCYGISIGNYCKKIRLRHSESYFKGQQVFLNNISVADKSMALYFLYNVAENTTKFIEGITFLQGGRDAEVPMEISLDDYATDTENTSPTRIACYNSAGEYKIFTLADLAPA